MKINRTKVVEVDAAVLAVHVKVCDAGSYEILDREGEVIGGADNGYVPSFLPDSCGDYIILKIELASGKILNWSPPTRTQVEEYLESCRS